MKMKKMMFLMLTLFVLGAASMNAQVRIGGDIDPADGAVLDLNPNNNASNATTTVGGLSLTRVALTSVSQQLSGSNPQPGTIVYNTGAGLEGAGLYVWTTQWTKVAGLTADADGIIGNEITDTIAGGGLNRTGSGTAALPYKVGIKTGGVATGMIAAKAVTTAKIADRAVDSLQLANNAVRSVHIKNEAITNAKIAPEAVTSTKIAEGSVGYRHIATLPTAAYWTAMTWKGTGWAGQALPVLYKVTIATTVQAGTMFTLTNASIGGDDVCVMRGTPLLVSPYNGGAYIYNPTTNPHNTVSISCIGYRAI